MRQTAGQLSLKDEKEKKDNQYYQACDLYHKIIGMFLENDPKIVEIVLEKLRTDIFMCSLSKDTIKEYKKCRIK